MSDSNSFRMRLDFALTQSGLSKADLARAIGETPQLINKWTNSEYKNLPVANYIAKVSKALKINMIWLLKITVQRFGAHLTGGMILIKILISRLHRRLFTLYTSKSE